MEQKLPIDTLRDEEDDDFDNEFAVISRETEEDEIALNNNDNDSNNLRQDNSDRVEAEEIHDDDEGHETIPLSGKVIIIENEEGRKTARIVNQILDYLCRDITQLCFKMLSPWEFVGRVLKHTLKKTQAKNITKESINR